MIPKSFIGIANGDPAHKITSLTYYDDRLMSGSTTDMSHVYCQQLVDRWPDLPCKIALSTMTSNGICYLIGERDDINMLWYINSTWNKVVKEISIDHDLILFDKFFGVVRAFIDNQIALKDVKPKAVGEKGKEVVGIRTKKKLDLLKRYEAAMQQ